MSTEKRCSIFVLNLSATTPGVPVDLAGQTASPLLQRFGVALGPPALKAAILLDWVGMWTCVQTHTMSLVDRLGLYKQVSAHLQITFIIPPPPPPLLIQSQTAKHASVSAWAAPNPALLLVRFWVWNAVRAAAVCPRLVRGHTCALSN